MQLEFERLKNKSTIVKSNVEAFTKTTELISRIFNIPISLLTSEVLGKQWWYSQNGENTLIDELSSLIPKSNENLLINDTLEDILFNNNPLVEKYNVRFIVSIPIFSSKMKKLAALTLIDNQPRTLSTDDIEILTNLCEVIATNVMNSIELEMKAYQEQSLYDFLEVTTSSTLSFREKIESVLELGYRRFKNENSEIQETKKNFCEKVTSTILENSSAGLEENLINTFSSNTILSKSDLDFIKLIAQWIGYSQEQIESERERVERIELFRQVIENSREAFWIYDLKEQKVLYTSPSWEEIWGRSNSEYHQNPCIWDESLHPEDKEQIIERLTILKESSEFEYRIVKPEGGIYWIRDSIIPLFDNQGKLYRIAGIAEDITEARMNEDMLRKSDKLAAVGQLAAGFAHEIRNPLTSIKGFIQLRRESIGSYSPVILSELERIELIVKEFLMLAKPHQEIKFETNDLQTIIREVILLLESQANLNDIEFIMELPEASQLVFCEPHQIKQVLINIINNSIDSMQSGGRITINLKRAQEQHVYIEIQDEGIGIAEDRLARLGEPFYSNKEKGTGLGLMVSYKIIENHKGKIEINSEVSKGTRVRIFLPVDG